MLTTLLLAATLAGPPADWSAEFAPPAPAGKLTMADFDEPKRDAGQDAPSPDDIRATAAALQLDLDAEVLLSSRAGQRLVNSALLCQSVALLTAEGHSTPAARRRLAAIGVAATERLERARIVPLACNAYPVERLVGCLGLLPSAECTEDDELVTQVRATERLVAP